MNIKKVLLPLALINTLLPSLDSYADYGVYDFGNKSCSQWIADRKSDNDSSRFMQVWMTGFVSGTGYVVGDEIKQTDSDAIKKETDSFDMSVWVDNYCKEHPLDILSVAVGKMVDTLQADIEKQNLQQ